MLNSRGAKMKLTVLISLYMITLHCVSAKTFSRCELAQTLKRHGFTDLRNWVCLIEAESSRRTKVISGPKRDGSYEWGLFQITDRHWCTVKGPAGKFCNARCKEFLSNDITKAVSCAKMIYNNQGFRAWKGWRRNCARRQLPDLSSCRV